jgi:hypothetical protein
VAGRGAAVALPAHRLRPCAASGHHHAGWPQCLLGHHGPPNEVSPGFVNTKNVARIRFAPPSASIAPPACVSASPSLSRRQPRLCGAKAAKAPSRPLGLTIVLMTGTLRVARGCFPIGFCPKSKTKRLEISHGDNPCRLRPGVFIRARCNGACKKRSMSLSSRPCLKLPQSEAGSRKPSLTTSAKNEKAWRSSCSARRLNPQSPARRFEQLDGITGRIVE